MKEIFVTILFFALGNLTVFAQIDTIASINTDSLSLKLVKSLDGYQEVATEENTLQFPIKEQLPIASSAFIDSVNYKAIEAYSIGDYQKALEYITVAYEEAKKRKNQNDIARTLNTLGLIYWRLSNNKEAMACYEQAAIIAKKLEHHKLLGLTYTNRGLIHKEEKNYELAFFNNNKAIKIFRKYHYYRELAIALNNQGQIFKNQSLIDSAKNYYESAIEYYKKANYKDGMAATYYNLSEIYMRKNMYEASLQSGKKSLALGIAINSKVRISEAYRRLSETFEYFQETDSALYYYKLFKAKQDDILIANQSENLARYQARMGAEVKNLQIQNLEKEKELANNKIWFIVIAILIILLITGFIGYRYLSKIRFKERKLEIELTNSRKIIAIKEEELRSYILDLTEKTQLISKLKKKTSLSKFEETENASELAELRSKKILTNTDWQVFKHKFEGIYPTFFTHIEKSKANLTEAEIRYMVLLRLELSSKEMSKILGISPQSVRVCKMRLKKKLQKNNFNSVEDYLKDITHTL